MALVSLASQTDLAFLTSLVALTARTHSVLAPPTDSSPGVWPPRPLIHCDSARPLYSISPVPHLAIGILWEYPRCLFPVLCSISTKTPCCRTRRFGAHLRPHSTKNLPHCSLSGDYSPNRPELLFLERTFDLKIKRAFIAQKRDRARSLRSGSYSPRQRLRSHLVPVAISRQL